MKIILAYLKKIFLSPIFYLCIVGITVITYSGMPIENCISYGVLSAFDVMLDISSYRKLIMILACIPVTSIFCQEYGNGFTNFIVIRSNSKKYIYSHIVSNFFISFLTAFIGMMICVLIMCCFYKYYIPANEISVGAIIGLYDSGHEYLFLFLKLFIYSFSLAAWSLSGLALSALFVNSFIAITSPLVFSYILEMLTIDSSILPDLWHLSLGYTSISDNTFIALGYIIAIFLSLSVFFSAVFKNIALRRIKNEIT